MKLKEKNSPAIDAGKIYLLPVPLSACRLSDCLPEFNIGIVKKLNYFVVENLRSARRFLKSCCRDIDIDKLMMVELNEHTPESEVGNLLEPVLAGEDAGILSEAGCPGIADPGALMVEAAQAKGIKVVPLIGPSSILTGLMASGFNGQRFTFNGYLPVEKNAREKAIRELEKLALGRGITQIFIETPYRNNRMLDELCRVLSPMTMLCVACDITGENESIISRRVMEWRNGTYDYDKRPAIFLIGGKAR